MRRMFRSALVFAFSGFYLYAVPLMAQEVSDTESKLRAVADAVLKDATFQFVDQKSGRRFASPEEAPSEAQLCPESAYTDWRYWNGVLNIAMIMLGERLNEPAYLEFARKNVAFSFDNYQYFEKKYKGEGKWNYPFEQRFIYKQNKFSFWFTEA